MPTQKSAGKWQLRTFRLLAQNIMKGIHSCKPVSLNCPKARLFLEQTQYVVDLKMDFRLIVFIMGTILRLSSLNLR